MGAAEVLTAFLAALAAFVGPTRAHGGLANYTVGDPPVWYRG